LTVISCSVHVSKTNKASRLCKISVNLLIILFNVGAKIIYTLDRETTSVMICLLNRVTYFVHHRLIYVANDLVGHSLGFAVRR
jgi:hypothetical protein